jgi:glucose/arabinose dehydrogenase
VRYTLTDDTLTFDRVIVDDLPGAMYHDGGRITFGPDGYLYVTVGDALSRDEAADPASLHGTTLRLTPTGEPAPGNPFDTKVYSYGHRNAQGLAWDSDGRLWSSEHGRSVGGSGFDEINLIQPGGNYGWPENQGDTVAPGTIAPARHSTADVTWAPGGLAYIDGSLYMPGLRGETLYEAILDGTDIVAWEEHFVGEYGRLRTVQVGPDGLLYVTTSNRDGRKDTPASNDDRLLRINPAML